MKLLCQSELDVLQQILSAGPHPHLFDDLLVQTGSRVLQFAASGLCKGVAALQKKIKEKKGCQQNIGKWKVCKEAKKRSQFTSL